MKEQNLKKGAIADGKSHEEGGIKTETPAGPLEIEGGEAVINKEATEANCELLSEINQSAGNGVAFDCNNTCENDQNDTAKHGEKTKKNNPMENKIESKDLDFLKGKFLHIYSLGDTSPIVREISNVEITPEHFEKRNITLFLKNSGQESFPLRNYMEFISGQEVKIIDGAGHPYVLKLSIAVKGTKTDHMKNNYYYLKIGNIITEDKKKIKIIGFDKEGLKVVDHSIIIKNQEPTGIDYQTFIRYMDDKAIAIEGYPYENDRDKLLLFAEVNYIKDQIKFDEHSKLMENLVIQKIGKTGSAAHAKKELANKTKGFEDTVAGMEAVTTKKLTRPEHIHKLVDEFAKFPTWKSSGLSQISPGKYDKFINDLIDNKKEFTDVEDLENYVMTQMNLKKYGVEDSDWKASKGVKIKDQYEGKEPHQIWDAWNEKQRDHFLTDHFEDIQRESEPDGDKYGTSTSLQAFASNKTYVSLPNGIKRALIHHIKEGQYKHGGVAPKKSKNVILTKDEVTKNPSEPNRIYRDVEGTIGDYHFYAKTDNSHLSGYGTHGINKGSVYKLSLRKPRVGAPEMDEAFAIYDNKWDYKPKSKADKDAVNAIVKYLDAENLKIKKATKSKKKSSSKPKRGITTVAERRYMKSHKKDFTVLKDAYPDLTYKALIAKHKKTSK